MKKLFILAAAIVAFASCSKEPETVINDGSIYFTNALTTRATTVTTTETLDAGFTVLGYVGTTEIFSNETATKSGNYWKTPSTKYWANDAVYNFFAVYPAISTEKLTSTDQVSASYNFTNDGSIDLVLAGRKVITGSNEFRSIPAQLVFKHALSRIRFSFTNAYVDNDNVDVTIDVTDVALIAENKTGTVTITTTENTETAKSSESSITWSDVKSNNTPITFAFDAEKQVGEYENATGVGIAENLHNTTDFKYIIPVEGKKPVEGETDTREAVAYNLACKIVAKDSEGNVIKAFDYTTNYIPLKVKKTGEAGYATDNKIIHEAGKSYTYNMNITSSLNDITFTVAVEDWIEEDGGEIDFPGDN